MPRPGERPRPPTPFPREPGDEEEEDDDVHRGGRVQQFLDLLYNHLDLVDRDN